jgi:uncharacterized protein YjdB
MKAIPVTGILWWKPAQWEKAKQISTDSHIFDDTYQDWKEGAENALKKLRGYGLTVYKIEIELEELVRWCMDQKMPLDATARSSFVSMKVQKHHAAQSK